MKAIHGSVLSLLLRKLWVAGVLLSTAGAWAGEVIRVAPASADPKTAPAISTSIAPPPLPSPAYTPPSDSLPGGLPLPASVHAANAAVNPTEKLVPIDLPSALALVNAANPTIALARERVAEAYAVLSQAKVLWVPNLWLGGNPYAPTFLPTFYHHNGTIQSSQGNVFTTVDKNAFFLPVGSALSVSFADAIFAPRIARRAAAAAEANARAVSNDMQLEVALAYLELLRAYGGLAINHEAIQKAEQMFKAAQSASRSGLGKTGADPDRARTEVEVLRQRRLVLQEDAARAGARLAELLLLDPSADLLPADQTVVPIALAPTDGPIDDLIAVALMNRPELAESRALIAAALARWRQAKYRPLIPTLQAFSYYGSYIAGHPTLDTAGGRTDVTAQLSWELRNLGFGDLYAARERRAQYNQANFQAVQVQSRVGAEVSAAVKIVRQRERALREAQIAVRSAEEMWRILEKAAFGISGPARQYDPLEPLLAERALLEARTLYLEHVIEYNRNQFRLYWALGQPPACALPQAKTQPLGVPVMPAQQYLPPGEREKKEVPGPLPPPRQIEPR
jgi:outer membrane protein TolC